MSEKDYIDELKKVIAPLKKRLLNIEVRLDNVETRLFNVEKEVRKTNNSIEEDTCENINSLTGMVKSFIEKLNKLDRKTDEIAKTLLEMDMKSFKE